MSVFKDSEERVEWLQKVMALGFTLRSALKREHRRTEDEEDKRWYGLVYSVLFDSNVEEDL